MKKIRLAICIGDEEYRTRLVACLMKHYKSQLELHVFENLDQLESERFDLLLLGDCEEAFSRDFAEPALYLYELGEGVIPDKEGGIYFVEKYQEVNRIVDEMLSHISEEVKQVRDMGEIFTRTKIAAIYSLSENEYQLPFAVTFGSILGEQGRVLLIDLQENSGLSRVMGETEGFGLEELLVMAESGNFSKKRLISCIGHGNGLDYIYPAENTECLCEAQRGTYVQMLKLLTSELDYDTFILNLGSRFPGFAELLLKCDNIYMLQHAGGLAHWREYEFVEELRARGYNRVVEHLIKVELPVMSQPAASFERLVEQWKWNELGDLIRRMSPQVDSHG